MKIYSTNYNKFKKQNIIKNKGLKIKHMIKVKSEYGKLKRVLLHRPGVETSNLTPSTFEKLLFDDAYFLPQAQKEHDAFAAVLKEAGVEVVYLEDLIAEVISDDESIKEAFFEEFIVEAGISKGTNLYDRAWKYLTTFKGDNKDLIVKIMGGVRYSELPVSTSTSLVELASPDIWAFEPLPNLVFTRDPFATVENGITLHHMANPTRQRETLFAKYIFDHHPDMIGTKRYYERDLDNSIEGGDVMILSDTKIAVGISMRTEPQAVEEFAKNIFKDSESKVDTVWAVNIPKGRQWMHLDTVFTQIDKATFSVFSLDYNFDFYKITKASEGEVKIEKVNLSLEEWVKKVLNLETVKLIVTGDGDPVYSEIEQWNDGSNVLAIAPNEVIVYDRNVVSNKALRDAGVKVHEIPSYELSRGRGGPRCMSMPLFRDDVQ